MTTLRTCAVLSMAALLGAVTLVPVAPAQQLANCEVYGKKALEQQKTNAYRKCGFTGPAWSGDLKAHIAWCRDVHPQDWLKQMQLREQMLAKCAPAK